MQVADESAPGGQHFAFVIPMTATAQAQLATLEVRGNGRSAVRASRQAPAALERAASAAAPEAINASRARLRWDASAQPMVMVRDPRSGQVLAFARNGDASISTTLGEVELVFSDGVRSAARVVRVRGR